MATEKISTNDSFMTNKELGEFVKSYGSLAEAAQKAAEAVSNVSEAAIVPDGTVETLKLVSGMYKTVTDSAISFGAISTETFGIMAGAAAGAAAYIASVFDNLSIKLEQEWDLVSESARAIYNQTAAYDESVEAAEENIEKANENAEAAKHYWEIIQGLVDENGLAKESTDKLQAAVAKLNEAAGTNVEVINGQIVGYKELSNVIGNTIEKTRIAAQKSYLWGIYGEAVVNIDDVEKQYEEAKKEREELSPIYAEKYHKFLEADYALNNFNGLIFDPSKYGLTDYDITPLLEEAKKAEDAFNEAQDRENALKQQLNSYKETIEKFESLSEEEFNLNNPYYGKSPDQISGEAYAKQMREKYQKAAELAKLGVKQTWEELESSLSDLDDKLAIHGIDDTEYWNERLKLLEDSHYEEKKEWWRYYDEAIRNSNRISDAKKKAYEDEIKAQADALKEMKETDENGYYDRLETLISTLDKESELYQKYNNEIINGRKALNDKIAREAAENKKAQIAEAAQTVKEVQAEYSRMLSDVLTEQESYKNKLMGMTNLYTSETKTDDNGNTTEIFTLENIDDQIKAVEAYDNKLKNLEKRGMGKGLTSYLEGLSQEDSEKVMHILADMSDDELKAYSDKYDKLMDTINERAENRYAPQVEEINNGFINRVRELMEQLPEDMQKLGIRSIKSFVKGFTGDRSELIGALSDELDRTLDGFSESVTVSVTEQNTESSSGNDFLSNIAGKSLAEVSGVGNTAILSAKKSSGNGLYLHMKDSELESIYERIVAERNLTVSGMTAGQQLNSYNYYASAPQSSSKKNEKIILQNHEDIRLVVDGEVLAKTVRERNREYKRRTGT